MTQWIYMEAVRPIQTYGSLVWWMSNFNLLQRLQRSAGIITSEALPTTPTSTLEMILDLSQLDVYCKGLVARVVGDIVRLINGI